MISMMVQNFLKTYGEMKLGEAKEQQNIFKSNLNKTLEGRFKSKEQKGALKTFNCFTSREKLLLNYLMVILQLYLRLKTKQDMEKD